MSTGSEQVKKFIFLNRIPVKIVMDNCDIANDKENPLPLYTFFHSIHYPLQYYEKILQIFERYLPPPLGLKHMWLQYKENQIPWNQPFGVFVDLHLEQEDKDLVQKQPLELVLHFRNQQENQLSQFDLSNIELGYQLYKYNLKQSLAIRYQGEKGRDLLLVQMTAEKQEQLWQHYCNVEQFKFYTIFQNHLWENQFPKEKEKQKIPIRINIKGESGRLQLGGYIKQGQEQYLKQQQLHKQQKKTEIKENNLERIDSSEKLQNQDNSSSNIQTQIEQSEDSHNNQNQQQDNQQDFEQLQDMLLGHYIAELFPEIISIQENDEDQSQYFVISEDFKDLKILCQGVNLDLNVSLKYLLENMFHMDGFTYLVIKY